MMRKEDFFNISLSHKKTLNIGDRVRFLNSVGGGTVTALRGKDQVLVEDENGFDIPVLISECVVIGETDRRMENTEQETRIPSKKHVETCSIASQSFNSALKAPNPVEYQFEETPNGERISLNLAFLPVEPKVFMQTSFDTYLINESNYFLYINYMSCNNYSWTSRFHGLIEPDTKIFLEEFPKSAINELSHLCIQLIAFKKGKTYSLKNPLSVELRPDIVKFYKLHCFTKNNFFDEEAMILPIVIHDIPERQMLVSASDIQAAMYDKRKDERFASLQVTPLKKPAESKIEVDLHINQLVETTKGMSNTDMLNCQLAKFHETMKANTGKKGQKIVFIHGKGEGVLRLAMEKELKTTYKNRCRFQDASFREYGFGATLATMY